MTIYSITSTDASKTIVVNAGTTNGPVVAPANIDTDLILYGQGSFNWGQGIEQNLFRIMESFASPAKNPLQPDEDQVPDPEPVAANPDLYGIKNPVIGQTWFNKSNKRLYVCTIAATETEDAVWKLDGEGRFLDLKGGELSGNVKIIRPAGNGGTGIELISKDELSPMYVQFEDLSAVKGRLFVEQEAGTGVDTLKFEKRVNETIKNSIHMHDGYIETHATQGKIRTPSTIASDTGQTLATKNYVDFEIAANGFDDGIFEDDITVSKPNAGFYAKSTNNTTDPKFVLADSSGNKGKFWLSQEGTADVLVLSKGIFNGAEVTGTTQNEIRMTDTGVDFTKNITLKNAFPVMTIESTSPTSGSILYFKDNQAVKAELSILPINGSGSIDDLVLQKKAGSNILSELRMKDGLTTMSQPFEVLKSDDIIRLNPAVDSANVSLSSNAGARLAKFGLNSDDSAVIEYTSGTTDSRVTLEQNGTVTITKPRATDHADVEVTEDERLITKKYADSRGYIGIGRNVSPNRLALEKNGTSWRTSSNFVDIPTSTANLNSFPTNGTSNAVNKTYSTVADIKTSGLATVLIRISFSYALRVAGGGEGSSGFFTFAPVDIQYRSSAVPVGAWTDLVLPGIPMDTYQNVYSGQYFATTTAQINAAQSEIEFRFGNTSNEFVFGPINRTGTIVEKFDAVLIDNATFNVEY